MAVSSRHVTVLRNTSGSTQYFGYIPPYGVSLTNGQDVEVPGNIFDYFADPKHKVKRAAFDADVTAANITVLQLPSPRLWDATIGRVSELTIDNGSVVVVDAYEGSYGGSAPNPT